MQCGNCGSGIAMDCDPCTRVDPGPTPTPAPTPCAKLGVSGVFNNATVTVENGCITAVEEGEPFVYIPVQCCPDTPGGSGTAGIQGDRGESGISATVEVGTVTTVGSSQPAAVENVGSLTAAKFNFKIPAGPPGADGASPTGDTNNTAGIDIQTGLIKDLPANWPPVMQFATGTASSSNGITLTLDKNAATGVVTVSISDANYTTFVNGLVSPLSAAIVNLQDQITALEARLAAAGIP